MGRHNQTLRENMENMSAPPSYEKSQAAYPDLVGQEGYNYDYKSGGQYDGHPSSPPLPPQQYGGQYGPPPTPQYGFTAPAPGPQVVFVANPPLEYGKVPVTTTCPHCRAMVTTSVSVGTGTMAWVTAGILCALSCCLVAWIPLCMNSLKDATHRCPNCNSVIGRYKAKL